MLLPGANICCIPPFCGAPICGGVDGEGLSSANATTPRSTDRDVVVINVVMVLFNRMVIVFRCYFMEWVETMLTVSFCVGNAGRDAGGCI